ncbi:hypothetical protein BO71DRAFT_447373 [Aspergillus ellipticus CBS 707.79]|uniref:Zn(2)-C6 fungal-type domain-containing protein n=1 Tax=Aspergillus ellipticus CBS 707.79 TaxID=1448320 RepID=A0A319F0X6_9EURO|nr:hypothetical protein BO71DRAFT_447373 [Aspergillus ellipticus CBS 707.79]
MQGILHLNPPAERVYHARRAHRKSRAGCTKCKQRRVKCDEAKPHCLRCQKLGYDCSYDASPGRDIVAVSSPNSQAYCLSLDVVSSKIKELLQIDSKNSLPHIMQALHHFRELANPALGPKRDQEIMQGKIIRLGFDSPFLMHTIIAAATSHIHHSAPEKSTYALMETYHWQQAITQYSRALTTIGPDNTDSLISTCLLMTIRSFALEEYNPLGSFVFSDDMASLNWLSLQAGLRFLIYATRGWQGGSMWWEVFNKADNSKIQFFDDESAGRGGMDPELADLCGIDETTTAETNPYHAPVRMLTGVLALERGMKSFGAYAGLMGRLLPDFFEKLMQKDPPALVILSWWLALMHGTELWWVQTRARSEIAAICWYLGSDEDVVRRLEFPAACVGEITFIH